MKNIIFGTTHFAEMMYYYLSETSKKVCAFTVNEKYISDISLPCDIIPFEELDKYYHKEECKIIPAIGYFDMNDRRKSVFAQIKNKGYYIDNFIHPTSCVAKNVEMGYGTIILENTVIQPFVKIGTGNIFMSNITVSHNSQIGDYNWFAPGTTMSGNVIIKDNCFLGSNCTVKNEIKIEDYTLIGAGSYVSKDTKSHQLIKPMKSMYIDDIVYSKF